MSMSETVTLGGMTSLYCKPTDSHNYLLFSSEQFIRIKRLCSQWEDFLSSYYISSTPFIRRGYPKHLVKSSPLRAESLPREDLLNLSKGQTPNPTFILLLKVYLTLKFIYSKTLFNSLASSFPLCLQTQPRLSKHRYNIAVT